MESMATRMSGEVHQHWPDSRLTSKRRSFRRVFGRGAFADVVPRPETAPKLPFGDLGVDDRFAPAFL
jgi:hypothetical protein